MSYGGEGGIRTPDTLSGMAAFEAARFNRSRTSPRQKNPVCCRSVEADSKYLLSILPVLI
jgi:hypothetical protein